MGRVVSISSSTADPAPPPGGPCVLLNHGEAFLKGRNKRAFIDRLHENLRVALRGAGGTTWIKLASNVTVLGGEVSQDELVRRARWVIGFHSVQPAVRVPSELPAITDAAVRLAAEACAGRPSFAVQVRRRHKGFAPRSAEIKRLLGARIQQELDLPVDLSRPQLVVSVMIDRSETYVSRVRLPGQGGLPVGSGGRGLVLLSGGFDSPVAAHRAMRRGVQCDFVHFSGAPYTNPNSAYKAYALAHRLNRHQPAGRLYVVALGRVQKELAMAQAGKLHTMTQRRLMLRTASALAAGIDAEALITGDSLGQVASQTLANLSALDDAAQLPVLRPLLGWDKQEIIDAARALGTAEVSMLPDEDCCRVFAPAEATTRAEPTALRRLEQRLDVDEVVRQLLNDVQVMQPGAGG